MTDSHRSHNENTAKSQRVLNGLSTTSHEITTNSHGSLNDITTNSQRLRPHDELTTISQRHHNNVTTVYIEPTANPRETEAMFFEGPHV